MKLFTSKQNEELQSKLESVEQENTELREQLETAQTEGKEFSEKNAELQAELQTKCDEITNLQGSVQAKDEQIAEMTACISKLEAEAKETQEKVGNKAAELLASAGHVAPVNLTDDSGETNAKLISRKEFNALTPHDRLQFVKAGGKIK